MVFSHLPPQFFVPLASTYREHYAALLLIYYRLFLEYNQGVERDAVVSQFASYFASLDEAVDVDDETTQSDGGDAAGDPTNAPPATGVIGSRRPPVAEPDTPATDATGGDSGVVGSPVSADSAGNADRPSRPDDSARPQNQPAGTADPRALASLFLRRLIAYGWVDEESDEHFERFITIRSHARPFFEALESTDRGTQVEYESHIVAVYSSLTGDSAGEHGEHAVLNAHHHTRMLVESLKVLNQNIRSYVQAFFDEDRTIPEILRSHYDVYMHEVVDRAYSRLKTSDNLSRYRPQIGRAVAALLDDEEWMARTAGRIALIQRVDTVTAVDRVRRMLREIRDDLKLIDPILESIDDRNRRFSRISTERIRAQLHADHTLHGRISSLISSIATSPQGACPLVVPKVTRLRYVDRESLFAPRTRELAANAYARPVRDEEAEELAAAELRMRASGQLNPGRVAAFLDRWCTSPGQSVWAEEVVSDVTDYVRVLYAAGYAERPDGSFRYRVEWSDEEESCSDLPVTVGRFRLPKHRFIRGGSRG